MSQIDHFVRAHAMDGDVVDLTTTVNGQRYTTRWRFKRTQQKRSLCSMRAIHKREYGIISLLVGHTLVV
jgi:predicted double-glycine peptidase